MSGHGEVWRPVNGWEHSYEVSSHGRVRLSVHRHPHRPHVLKTSPAADPRVVLSDKERTCRLAVHLLVAEAFLGWQPGQAVRARDGDRGNVWLDNLEVVGEVASHPFSRRSKPSLRGTGHAFAKLTADDVRRTMQLRGAASARQVAEELGVSTQTIRSIWRGKAWRHLTGIDPSSHILASVAKHAARHPDEKEEWRPVVGWESLYEVSSLGCVRRADGMVLTSHLNRGHPTVILKRDGKDSVRAVSHLVLEAFLSAPGRRYYQVVHRDGDRTNNRVENVEWKTQPVERTPRPRRGRKLTWEQVKEIRTLADAYSRAELARRFGVSKRLVVQIVLGTRWKASLTAALSPDGGVKRTQLRD
jgi:DNA-binding XRE family transcriptional regulator